MDQTLIFWPFLAQIALTLIVLPWLAYSRVSRIAKQGMAEIAKTGFPAHVKNASDNLKNQFEIPVLFYALCLFFYVTGGVTKTVFIAAWIFIVARILHALVHLTKNIIFPYRFGAFFISVLSVLFITILAAIHMASI